MPGVLLCCSSRQAHRGAPLADFLLCRSVPRVPKGTAWVVVLCSSVCQVFDGPASLLFSRQVLACGKREVMVMAPSHTHDSAVSPCFHGCLAFLHRHFPPHLFPHVPLVWPSAVNSIPHPGIAPQSLSSSSQLLHLLGDLHPCPGHV